MGISFPEGYIPTLKWVSFVGSNGSIYSDSGISSVTRNSTGRYTINFDGNMSNNDYALVGNGEYEYAIGIDNENHNHYAASYARIWHGRYGSGTSADGTHTSVMIVGSA